MKKKYNEASNVSISWEYAKNLLGKSRARSRFRKQIFRSEDFDLVHHTLSANCSGAMFDVCERLVPVSASFKLK